MKSIIQYIKESGETIKFKIWEEPGKQVAKLKDNESYNKIEYQYKNIDMNIYISFMLGFKDDSWKLWCAPLGKGNYMVAPLQDLKTNSFEKALSRCEPYINEYIEKVKNNPGKYVMYYKY